MTTEIKEIIRAYKKSASDWRPQQILLAVQMKFGIVDDDEVAVILNEIERVWGHETD